MKKTIYCCLLTAAAVLPASCNKYLDMTPRDSVSDRVIWATAENAELAVNDLYSYLLDVYQQQFSAGLTESLTDQFKYCSTNYDILKYVPSEVAYGGSTLTATYVNSRLGRWSFLYGAIRRTNQCLSGLHGYGVLAEEDARRIEGELRLLRAWFYFELLKRYREVIVYDEDLEAMSRTRALDTEEAGWDFVAADLAFAEENLPVKADAAGRLDRGMAYAFATRALLYAERYEAVVKAADAVASLGYSLESDYESSWQKTMGGGNVEAILQYTFDYSNDVTYRFDRFYAPSGDYSAIGATAGGYGSPTQEMVESYEFATGGFPDWSAWHTTSGTTAEPPYTQLEPRFQATVLYNGAPWKGRTIEPFVGGLDGWAQWRVVMDPFRTVTGYYLKKGLDPAHDPAQDASTQPITLLRYGEVLLNKAEACFRASDAAGANAAVRAIRSRAGLPYSDLEGDALWRAIRQERRVELAFEGLWYWDLRRWREAAEDYPVGLNGYQVHGLKIERAEQEGEFLYTYVSVDDRDRNFPEKLYRFPLPESELASNSALTQFAEWR